MNWKEALEAIKNGKKVALPEWKGYWYKSGETIMMHCKSGAELNINGQMADVFFTMENITRSDWEVVD